MFHRAVESRIIPTSYSLLLFAVFLQTCGCGFLLCGEAENEEDKMDLFTLTLVVIGASTVSYWIMKGIEWLEGER